MAAEQRAVERAQANAERLASIQALRATLAELVAVHRGVWPPASRPVIARLRVVDREAVVKHVHVLRPRDRAAAAPAAARDDRAG